MGAAPWTHWEDTTLSKNYPTHGALSQDALSVLARRDVERAQLGSKLSDVRSTLNVEALSEAIVYSDQE